MKMKRIFTLIMMLVLVSAFTVVAHAEEKEKCENGTHVPDLEGDWFEAQYTECGGGYKYDRFFCSVCGKLTNRDGEEVPYTEGTGVHVPNLENVKKADYTPCGGGYKEDYYICKFEPCNLYIDANGQEVVYYQPEEGAVHDLEYVPEVPWTEEADGCREHWKCLVCEKLFADEAGTQRVWLSELLFGKPSTDVKPEEDNKDDVKEEISEDSAEQEKGNVPKTGDVSAVMLWALAAVGAGSSILAVGKKKL